MQINGTAAVGSTQDQDTSVSKTEAEKEKERLAALEKAAAQAAPQSDSDLPKAEAVGSKAELPNADINLPGTRASETTNQATAERINAGTNKPQTTEAIKRSTETVSPSSDPNFQNSVLEKTVPGYKTQANTPEEHQNNTRLLLARLEEQNEAKRKKLGLDSTEYPGQEGNKALSANPAIAKSQIAEQEKQTKEAKRIEAETAALEKNQNIHDLAKDLSARGLFKEADAILSKDLLGENLNKTIASLKSAKEEAIKTEGTKAISVAKKQAQILQKQEDKHNQEATKNRGALNEANNHAAIKSKEAQKNPKKQELADGAEDRADQKRKILNDHNTSEEAKTRHQDLLQANQNLSEAEKLLAAGDHHGASLVARGDAYERQVEFDPNSLQLGSVEERPRYAGLPEEIRNGLNYKDAVDDHITAQQEGLKALQTQAESFATQHENWDNTGERREAILEQELQLQEKIAEETRTLEQSQQYQAHLTSLIDEGNYAEIAKLKSGESKLETTVSYNSKTASENAAQKPAQESVQELLINRATDLRSRAKEIKSSETNIEKLKQVQRAQDADANRWRGIAERGQGRGGVAANDTARAKEATAKKHQDEVLTPALEKARGLQDTQRKDSIALLEATKLAEKGDLEGARKVLSGESHKRVELSKITDGLKLINSTQEKELGRDAYNEELTQQFRETLQGNIEKEQATLTAMNAYMIVAQRMIDEPGVSAEYREKILSQMTATEVQRQEHLRATSQLQQQHSKLTELQVAGDFETARSLIEGKQSILPEQTYNPSEKDYAQAATKDYARTETESRKLAETLLNENTRLRQNAQKAIQLFEDHDGNETAETEKARTLFNKTQLSEAQATQDIKEGNYEKAIADLRKANTIGEGERQGIYDQTNEDFREGREDFEKWDRYYGYAETVSKTAGYVAVGAVAAAATGGAAAALLAANYGTLLMAAGAVTAGTAAGTGAGIVLEGGRGLAGMGFGQTSEQAFDNFWGKVGEHAKNSAIDSVGTVTGLKLVQVMTKGGGASTALKITANALGDGTESLVSFGITTVDARYQAAAEYEASKPDMSYEDFLKERGLDAGSLVKNAIVDMTVNGLTGAKTAQTEVLGEQAQALARALGREVSEVAAKQARRELTDHAFSASTSLVGEVIKGNGELSVEALTQAILEAPVQTLTSRMRIDIAEKANHKNAAADDTQISQGTPETLNTGHTTDVDPSLRVEGRTVTEVNPDGTRKDTVTLKTDVVQAAQDHSAATREARITKLEETVHANQEPVDALQRDQEGNIKLDEDGKPEAMSRDENYARRSLNEMRAEYAARETVLSADRDAAGSKQEKAQIQAELEVTRSEYGKKLSQTEELIASGNHKEALDFAKENGISEADIKNFEVDYDHNVARDLETGSVKQTSFNSSAEQKTTEQIIDSLNQVNNPTADQITQIKKDIENLDFQTLSPDQKQKIQGLIDKLKEQEIDDPQLMGQLAYLTGNSESNARQLMTEAIDHAFASLYTNSGRDTEVLQNYFDKDLGPRIEAQKAELQKLLTEKADDASVKQAFEKLHKLAIEKSAVMAGFIMQQGAGADLNIKPEIQALNSSDLEHQVIEGLDTDEGRQKARDYIRDFSLSEEQLSARAETLDEIDNMLYLHDANKKKVTGEDLAKEITALDPQALNETTVAAVNSLLDSAEESGIEVSAARTKLDEIVSVNQSKASEAEALKQASSSDPKQGNDPTNQANDLSKLNPTELLQKIESLIANKRTPTEAELEPILAELEKRTFDDLLDGHAVDAQQSFQTLMNRIMGPRLELKNSGRADLFQNPRLIAAISRFSVESDSRATIAESQKALFQQKGIVGLQDYSQKLKQRTEKQIQELQGLSNNNASQAEYSSALRNLAASSLEAEVGRSAVFGHNTNPFKDFSQSIQSHKIEQLQKDLESSDPRAYVNEFLNGLAPSDPETLRKASELIEQHGNISGTINEDGFSDLKTRQEDRSARRAELEKLENQIKELNPNLGPTELEILERSVLGAKENFNQEIMAEVDDTLSDYDDSGNLHSENPDYKLDTEAVERSLAELDYSVMSKSDLESLSYTLDAAKEKGLDISEARTQLDAHKAEISQEGLNDFRDQVTQSIKNQAEVEATKTEGPKADLARDVAEQDTQVHINDSLPDGVKAQTTVSIDPETGKRSVTIEARSDVAKKFLAGDTEARKTMLEEAAGHARERVINTNDKDGKPRSLEEYSALRARQELVSRAVGAAKAAGKEGASAAKKDLTQAIKSIDEHIKAGNHTEALKIAEENGIGEQYKKQYDADYNYNENRTEGEGLKQTSYSTVEKIGVEDAKTYSEMHFEEIENRLSGNPNMTDAELDAEVKSIGDRYGGNGKITLLADLQNRVNELKDARAKLAADKAKNETSAEKKAKKIEKNAERNAEIAAAKAIKQKEIDDTLKALQLLEPSTNKEQAEVLVEAVRTQMIKNTGDITSDQVLKALTSDVLSRAEADVVSAGLSKGIGDFHELRLQVALIKALESGSIKGFIMAKGNTGGGKTSGLDALGVDAIVQLKNGDYIVIQAKSSKTGVDENFNDSKPYTDEHGKNKTIHHKGNNPINLSGMSITAIEKLLVSIPSRRDPDPNRNPVIIPASQIGTIDISKTTPQDSIVDPSIPKGSPTQMDILESLITY